MKCCTYPWPHLHYPAWLRTFPSIDMCKCGQHPRVLTFTALMTAWERGHR